MGTKDMQGYAIMFVVVILAVLAASWFQRRFAPTA